MSSAPRDTEICAQCMGSGFGGHPDSGEVCGDCHGSGGVDVSDATALFIELGAFLDPRLTERHRKIVLDKLKQAIRSARSAPTTGGRMDE